MVESRGAGRNVIWIDYPDRHTFLRLLPIPAMPELQESLGKTGIFANAAGMARRAIFN